MVPTAPPDPEKVVIRFATTDDEVIALHRFLLIVAKPAMRCPVDPVKSMEEVFRVCAQEAGIMAILDDKLVGTLGVMKAQWWYGIDGQNDFLTDRWHFCLPQFYHTAVDRRLMEEAQSIADAAGLEFIDQGKLHERRGKLLMMPRVHVPRKE